MSSSRLLINLSLVGTRRTGLANYAANLVPELTLSHTALLIPEGLAGNLIPPNPFQNRHLIPANMSADDGKIGHLRRLIWTQFKLPKLYSTLRSQLIFSPIPEAPLFSQCRTVVMVHDLIPLRFPNRKSPLYPYFRYYIPQVLKQAKHILCNSQATAQEIIDFFHIPAHQITPIPLAYDHQHFQNLELPTQNYFVYLGRHDPHKNVARVLDAFAALSHCKDYELWLVGPTDARYTPRLLAQAAHLGIQNQLKILDYVPYADLPRIIHQAIALVFPSLWEGFGFPVLEAMACGTPVVTSDRAALPEVAGDAALLVNPEQAEEIAAAMQAIATEPTLRSQLQAAGLARASQFRWAKTAELTAHVLTQFM